MTLVFLYSLFEKGRNRLLPSYQFMKVQAIQIGNQGPSTVGLPLEGQ